LVWKEAREVIQEVASQFSSFPCQYSPLGLFQARLYTQSLPSTT
jgi:hypothetical protein